MNNKRFLSLALAILMALSLMLTAASCADSDDGSADTNGGTQAGADTESDTTSAYDELEKEQYDRDFTVMTRDDCVDDFVVEGMKGDILGDSLYERNTVVAEDYGVEFVFRYQGNSYSTVNEAVKTQVTSGLDDYDMFIGHKHSYTGLALNNYLVDMNKITTMDLSGAWWDQGCYDNLTVNGN